MNEKVIMFDISFDNYNMDEAIANIDKMIVNNKIDKKFGTIVTPNVDHLVNINKDKHFKKIYEQADMKLVDGMPIVWVSKLLKKPLKERVTGADLTPKLIELANKKKYKVFIFGSNEGVAQKAVDKYKGKYSDEFQIGCYSPPFGFEQDKIELNKCIEIINDFQPDILLVSLGSPKGEYFIFNNLENLKVPISIQIGAAIDFIAGTIHRAPVWMQKSGLEWFYRFVKEPKRMFKRYFIKDIHFFKLVLKELYTR